jgi:hypothetical protein
MDYNVEVALAPTMKVYLDNDIWRVDHTGMRTDSFWVAEDIPIAEKACFDLNDHKVRKTCGAVPVNPSAGEIKYYPVGTTALALGMRAYLENGVWMAEDTANPRTDAMDVGVLIPLGSSACIDTHDNKIKLACPLPTVPVTP